MGTENGTKHKILFYRYGNICEPDLIDCFSQAGLAVTEECTQITKKDTMPSETAESVSRMLARDDYLFVFSINYFPAVSEVCQICRKIYVFWTVDCPVMELFSPSLANGCNRGFFFDRAQYLYFGARMKSGCAFHLPLATNVSRWDDVIGGGPAENSLRFASDVSFVGSLYNEKNRCRELLTDIPDYTKGYLDALTQAQTHVYGYSFLEERLTPDILREMKRRVPALQGVLCDGNEQAKRFYVAHMLLDWETTQKERERLMELAASRSELALYTHSDTANVPHAKKQAPVKTLTEMPLVFRYSKINLNITMRAIETGLPLRVFDICGAGGFLLTNYQEELAEHFIIGEEVEVFFSGEEMCDKIAYYLAHDTERERIARRGYEKTKAAHTWFHRINTMIKCLTDMMA